MSIEKDLKKDGITIIEALDIQSIDSISKAIADYLCNALPDYNLNYDSIYDQARDLPMYIASMPNGIAEANYLYKNSSIYFRDGMGFNDLEKFAVHEFLHHFQEIKDKKSFLIRLGLCDLSDFKIYGMGLNEGAVQLITSKAINDKPDIVKYYNITFFTNSPNYYPLICNLVSQMSFVTGENILFDSTLFSNDKFKNEFSNLCGESNFIKIEINLDKIINTEEKIISLSNKLLDADLNEKTIDKINNTISKEKEKIRSLYFKTQDLIYTSYFNKQLSTAHSLEEIDTIRNELEDYAELIGSSTDYYKFDEYYDNIQHKIDIKSNSIINEQSLITTNQTIFSIIFYKLKNLVSKTH